MELYDLCFIILILWCFTYKLTVTRIGSLFGKFESECSITGIFGLDAVFAKKTLKIEQASSPHNVRFISFSFFAF